MLEFFIKRRVFVSMLFIGLSLTGYISYTKLPLELLPGIELPFLLIQVNSAQEMDPEFMEREAIIPLESAIGTLEGIESIESTAERRQGRIIVYYLADVNLKYAYLKLQEKVDAVKQNIPEDFFVTVFKIDTEKLSNMFMNLQLRGTGGVDRLRQLFDDQIRQEFESIDGIANVEVFGGREKSVEIRMHPEQAKAFNLTPNKIRSLIARNNRDKQFVGKVFQQQKELYVNLVAEYQSVKDLENIVVVPTVPLYLKDVAEIKFDVKEETALSRVNGKDAVTIQLIRDTRENLIDLSDETKKLIEKLNRKYKSDSTEIVIQQNLAENLENNIHLIQDLALMGGLIAVIILWYFLGNIQLVMAIGLALPISVFTAFNLFYGLGITLNSLTLVGMALAVGMLLDNSIVVLENIYRKYQFSKNAYESVLGGTKEIWRSIFAATLTTITVFVPFIFAENFMVRIIGYQIGVSIISTLVVSLVVALILIPMMVFFFLDKGKGTKSRFHGVGLKNRLVQIYLIFLKTAMRYPLRTVVGALIVFFMSIIIALAASISSQEEKQAEDFNLYVTMPGGATLDATDQAVADLETRLEGIDEVQDVISQIYEEEAVVTLTLKEEYEEINDHTQEKIKEFIEERINEYRIAEVSFDQPVSGNRFRGGGRDFAGSFERLLGIGGQEESIIIKGRDYEIMRRIADDIQYHLEDLSAIDRVRQNLSPNRPELHLFYDKQLLDEYEIGINNLASELTGFQPEISTGIKFKDSTNEYDILIISEDETDKDYEDLRTLPIESNSGGTFPMEQLSRLVFASGRAGINRTNQEREIVISYRFIEEVRESSDFLESSRLEIDQLLYNLEIPDDIAVERKDEQDDLGDAYFLISVAFILIFMILASVFESFLNPFVIMFTIPLAAIGSLWAIIFTDNSLMNANTLIGFLILLGIVVNNGIILIDYTRILRQNGFRRSRALINAGRARLRPILITALTTIAAMMPMATGRVEYVTSIAAPFAITVIGGLSLSTIFTLVLIPTVYSGLDVVVNWIRSLNWRIRFVQGLLFISGVLLIYFRIESTLWQFVNLFLLLFVIPAGTYFILNSLRRAQERLITDKDIIIRISNVWKLYDQPTQFVREWAKGKKLGDQVKKKRTKKTWLKILENSWQYLLWIYAVYFIYFYLTEKFWVFVLSHFLYFFTLHLISELRISSKIYKILFWFLPLTNLAILYFKGTDLVMVLFIGAFWYFALSVYTTSHRLIRDLVNINRIKGRFAGIRTRYYRLIQHVPVLGKRKIPFGALRGVSLEIGQGMFGLLGPNGAGKTTLMRIICGILEQTYGTIHFNDINALHKREELQGMIGYLPQEFGVYENLSAAQFLNYQAILKNITDPEERHKRVHRVIQAVHMEKYIDKKIGSFSGGMKQRIGIAQTLLHLPRILVVDEPTAGLDPRERIRFRNLLVELSRERVVIFSTHIIEDIASSCDRVAILNRGELKYLGAPAQMANLAKGNVWQCIVEDKEFEKINRKFKVVHHVTIDQKIRVRILADKKPLSEAVNVAPSLEDAYLWLLDAKQPGTV